MSSFNELIQYQSTISIERLLSFVLPEENPKNVSVKTLINRYEENILVSQAFYPILSILEITLRNSIDTMMKTKFGENWIEKELNQKTISRKQAEIISIEGKLYVKNISETNYTQVDGIELKPNEKVELKPNSTIRTGEIEFQYIL